MEILLISGKSSSGKDTFANILRKELEKKNYKCLIIHFADMVKYYARVYYNWNGEKDEAGRALLQNLGTDKVRAKFPNYWAEIVGKFLAAVSQDFDFAFIPDARFPNEIEIVKKYNPSAKSIRIERYNQDGTPFINPNFTLEQSNHLSETSLDDYNNFEYNIINKNNDLKALNDAAIELLKDLGILF